MFSNSLTSILKPLEKIEIKLQDFLQDCSNYIGENNAKISELKSINEEISEDASRAHTVSERLRDLLGKESHD